MKRLGMVALAALLLPATTVAQGAKQPSAIVEDVTEGIPGVAPAGGWRSAASRNLAIFAGSGFSWSRIAVMSEMVRGGGVKPWPWKLAVILRASSSETAGLSSLHPARAITATNGTISLFIGCLREIWKILAQPVASKS